MTAAGMTAAAIKGFLKQQEGRGRGRGIQWRKRADVKSIGYLHVWNIRVACGCVSLPWLTVVTLLVSVPPCAVLLNALGFGCINFSRLYDGGAQ